MFNYTPIRMGLILIYFLLCNACGAPADTSQQSAAGNENVTGDVNFVGGGTSAPEIPKEEEPYRSPTLSADPPPESLTRAPSIEQARRIAQGNNKYKIMAWFHGKDCVECPDIERKILADPDVIKASKNWIYVFIDVDVNPDRSEYYLKGGDPPAFMALDAGGYVYRKNFGVVTKDQFLTMLTDWR